MADYKPVPVYVQAAKMVSADEQDVLAEKVAADLGRQLVTARVLVRRRNRADRQLIQALRQTYHDRDVVTVVNAWRDTPAGENVEAEVRSELLALGKKRGLL